MFSKFLSATTLSILSDALSESSSCWQHQGWQECILSRFVQGTFDLGMPATIDAAFLAKVVMTSDDSVRL
jgi:hypothetical protein